MVNVKRSYPEPIALSKKRTKGRGKPSNIKLSKIKGVLGTLKRDFNNKCYICEQKEFTDMEIDHFIPHGDDKELMLCWDNLFFVCGHCNSVKSDIYNNIYTPIFDDKEILNCTDPHHDVVNWIKYEHDLLSEPMVILTTVVNDEAYRKIVDNTVELLVYVYSGKSIAQEHQAENLRKSLEKEMVYFYEILQQYY
ncbi:HNH endonuclease domain protein, partial [Candidatus Magnetobacterium bavaricum]